MKRKGYFEYDPMIYPRKLWVHIGNDLNDVMKSFSGMLPHDENVEYFGLTYPKAMRLDNNKYGIFVSFVSKKDMTMKNIAHECYHVVEFMENSIGMEHGGEASAYLLGWVASCITRARLGQGEFVDILIGESNKKTVDETKNQK